jgi:hypothetical protein
MRFDETLNNRTVCSITKYERVIISVISMLFEDSMSLHNVVSVEEPRATRIDLSELNTKSGQNVTKESKAKTITILASFRSILRLTSKAYVKLHVSFNSSITVHYLCEKMKHTPSKGLTRF